MSDPWHSCVTVWLIGGVAASCMDDELHTRISRLFGWFGMAWLLYMGGFWS